MRRYWVLWMVFIAGAAVLSAQENEPARFYDFGDAEAGYAVAALPAGGFLIGGAHTLSTFLGKILLIRTDAQGDTLWTYRSDSAGWVRAVVATADGFLCAGSIGTPGDFFVWKCDAAGNRIWSYRDGSPLLDQVVDIQQTSDGDFVMLGSWEQVDPGNSKFFLLTLDSSGTQKKFQVYDQPSGVPTAFAQTPDSGYVVVGTRDNGAFVAKIDKEGTLEWHRTFGAVMPDEFNDVAVTSNGDIWIVGTAVTFGRNGIPDMWVMKLNAQGDSLWSHVYGTPTNLDGARAMTPITDGSFWVAGWTFSVFTGYDAALWKIAVDGTLLDSLLLNPGDGNDRALAVTRTAQGVVATGESESGVGVQRDVFLWPLGGEPTSVAETVIEDPFSLRLSGRWLTAGSDQMGGSTLRLGIYTLTGAAVAHYQWQLPAAGWKRSVDLHWLPSGVYVLRWQWRGQSGARLLLLE